MCADAEQRGNSEDFAVAKVTECARAEAARLADDLDFASASRVSVACRALFDVCYPRWDKRHTLCMQWRGGRESGYDLSIRSTPNTAMGNAGMSDFVTVHGFFNDVANGSVGDIDTDQLELVGRIVGNLAVRADGLDSFSLPVGPAMREKLGADSAYFFRVPLLLQSKYLQFGRLDDWSRASGQAMYGGWQLSESQATRLDIRSLFSIAICPIAVCPISVTQSQLAYALQRALLRELGVEPGALEREQQRAREQERARQPSVCGPDLYGEEFELTAEELRAAELRIAGRKGAR